MQILKSKQKPYKVNVEKLCPATRPHQSKIVRTAYLVKFSRFNIHREPLGQLKVLCTFANQPRKFELGTYKSFSRSSQKINFIFLTTSGKIRSSTVINSHSSFPKTNLTKPFSMCLNFFNSFFSNVNDFSPKRLRNTKPSLSHLISTIAFISL